MRVLRSSGDCPNGKDCPNIAAIDGAPSTLFVQGSVVTDPLVLAELGDIPADESVVAIPASLLPELGGS